MLVVVVLVAVPTVIVTIAIRIPLVEDLPDPSPNLGFVGADQ